VTGALVDGVGDALSWDERAIAKECIVDPARRFRGPEVSLASFALGGAFGIIGREMGKRDELEVDAVRQDLCGCGWNKGGIWMERTSALTTRALAVKPSVCVPPGRTLYVHSSVISPGNLGVPDRCT